MAGVWLPRPVIAARVEARVQAILHSGLLEEVRALAAQAGSDRGPTIPADRAADAAGAPPETEQVATGAGSRVRQSGLSRTAGQALGYREILAHLAGECSLDEAVEKTIRRTCAFSRRQRMWFRRDPRITWYGTASDPFALLPALLGDWSHP